MVWLYTCSEYCYLLYRFSQQHRERRERYDFLTVLLTVLSLSVADTDSVRRLDLAGWVSLALDNSPELRSAEASLLSARASLTGDRSFLWPTLTGSASASRTWSDTPLEGGGAVQIDNDSYSAGLTLSQELLQSGGQNWLYMRLPSCPSKPQRLNMKAQSSGWCGTW